MTTNDILATINLIVLLIGFTVLNVVLWKARRASEELAEALKKVSDDS